MSKKLSGRTKHNQAKRMTEEIAQLAQVPGALEMLVTIAAEELGGPKGGKTKQVRLFNMGGQVGHAEGGLAQAAEQTRTGGRGDDEMLLHLAPEEYEAIVSMWGEPDINPNTGIPEYGFLSKLWKGIKKTVKKIVKSPLFSFIAPIALNIFAPGLGSAVGGWLGATGKAAATIGNTVLRTGMGALSGGTKGAISGALSGLVSSGVGSKLGSKLGLKGNVGKIAGDAVMGGLAGEGTGVGFRQGALGQGMASIMGNPMQKVESKLAEMGRGMFDDADPTIGSRSIADPDDPFGYGSEVLPNTSVGDPGDLTGLGTGPPSGAVLSGATADPSLWDKSVGWMKEHPWLTAGGALAVGSMMGGGGRGGDGGPPGRIDTGTNFYESLPNVSFDRRVMPIQDYYNYGRASADDPGEQLFFSDNRSVSAPPRGGQNLQPRRVSDDVSGGLENLTMQQQGWQLEGDMLYPPGWFGGFGAAPSMLPNVAATYALGGLVQKYAEGGSAHVRGPGTGRSDDIPAVLSDGEYIIDSESVALLGDGSTDAGARRLDEMREKLRRHKGKKLARGGFSDAAKTPEEYMAEGGKVKKKARKKVPKKALLDLKRLAKKLETAISTGNKKRVREISDQLKSLDGGTDIVSKLAEGGRVRRPMTDEERSELSDELDKFSSNSRFIRNLKRGLNKERRQANASQ